MRHSMARRQRRPSATAASATTTWLTLACSTFAIGAAFVLPTCSRCHVTTVAVQPATPSPLEESYHFASPATTTKRTSSGSSSSSNSRSTATERSTLKGPADGNGACMPEAGTPLRMICDEQREFELNLGKAMDTLTHDYPYILTEQPDYSIYSDDLEVVDPSGVKLHGISNYKNFFRLVHFIINTIYCPERSGLTFRLCYDCTRSSIRVHWNAYVIPKAIFGGTKTTLHVDGISVYEICRGTGKITQHRVEHLLINDAPVRPAKGIFHALHQEVDPDFIPVFNTGLGGNQVVPFQRPSSKIIWPTTNSNPTSSSLFAMSSSATSSEEDSNGRFASDDDVAVDGEALNRKNASRKKFGLKPLTPEEFVQLQAQVQQMDLQQQRRQAAAAAAAELSKKKDEERENFIKKLFGELLEDACESHFDCERPLVCCDFGFKKMCCASGTRVVEGQAALVPVPVDITGYPLGRGPQTPDRF